MAFASSSPISVPGGFKEISQINNGDSVMAWTPDGINPALVSFSSGTGPDGSQPAMVYVVYGDNQDLLLTLDQPVMTTDNKLIRARALKPGDQLLQAYGLPATVNNVSIGSYRGGVHSVATNAPNTGINGHLIIVNSIVCGDYFAEMMEHLWDKA